MSPAPRNRTLTLSEEEKSIYIKKLVKAASPCGFNEIKNRIILGDMTKAALNLPNQFADLLFLDPPYNLSRKFGENNFGKMPEEKYKLLFESWLLPLLPLLKPTASVYICADWLTSAIIFDVLQKHLKVLNRITWEREKGRGAARNWKNSCEDIWFCTVSNDYIFNLDKVKLRRRVIAPYKTDDGSPKDWNSEKGEKYRLTHPSNLWTDITVPFWSMPENTEHPTQKPEKLLAKLILASTNEDGVVLDPFCGSGTSCVTAKKLGRSYVGIEQEPLYAMITEKRLELAEVSAEIQGYENGVFFERNAKRR